MESFDQWNVLLFIWSFLARRITLSITIDGFWGISLLFAIDDLFVFNVTSHQPATQDYFRRAGHRHCTAGAGVEEMNESPLGFVCLQPADCATDGNAGPEAASGWGQDAVAKRPADHTPSASTQPDKGVSSIIYPLLFPFMGLLSLLVLSKCPRFTSDEYDCLTKKRNKCGRNATGEY